MPEYKNLTNLCYVKPSYQLLQMAYEDYKVDSAPCKAGVTNQCAVRMSVALERCGFSLNAFDPSRRVHRGRSRCKLSIQHVLGANELARYLRRLWGEPETFRRRSKDNADETLGGKKGVIYFNNCFRRSGQASKRGDHIDLWNGEKYYNQIIHIGAGGDAGTRASLFSRSDSVWFFTLNS